MMLSVSCLYSVHDGINNEYAEIGGMGAARGIPGTQRKPDPVILFPT
jgi:hypothetical protein